MGLLLIHSLCSVCFVFVCLFVLINIYFLLGGGVGVGSVLGPCFDMQYSVSFLAWQSS